MKAKDVVTLVLLVVGIAIAYAAVKRSGLDRAFLGATSGGDIARGPNVRADVMTGPLTGSGPGGGPGSFGVTSSPIVNNVGVASGGPPAPFVGVTPNLVTLGGTIVGIGGGGFAGRPQDFFRAIAPGPATVGAAAPAAILSSSGLTADERASDIADRLGLGQQVATQLDPQLEELARRIGELVSERRYSGSELSAFSPSVVQARGFAVNLRATDGAKRILGNDPTREQVVIQNTSASDIEVGGADLVLGQGLVVGANAERALGDFPGEVYLVTAAAGPLNIRIRVESAQVGRTGAYYIPSLPGIPGVLTDAQHGARTLAGAHVSADITNAWRRIAQSILAAPAASIDFQGIPATFEELMLTLIGNQDGVGSSNCSLRVNNDAGLTYHTQELRGVAAVASATESAAQSELLVGLLGNAAGHVSALRIYIPGYAGATFQKVIFSVSARKTSDLAGGFTLNMRGGFWASAAAIDRLTLFSNDGSFRVGTRATLYGIAA